MRGYESHTNSVAANILSLGMTNIKLANYYDKHIALVSQHFPFAVQIFDIDFQFNLINNLISKFLFMQLLRQSYKISLNKKLLRQACNGGALMRPCALLLN